MKKSPKIFFPPNNFFPNFLLIFLIFYNTLAKTNFQTMLAPKLVLKEFNSGQRVFEYFTTLPSFTLFLPSHEPSNRVPK